jgi:hypothetical protein
LGIGGKILKWWGGGCSREDEWKGEEERYLNMLFE